MSTVTPTLAGTSTPPAETSTPKANGKDVGGSPKEGKAHTQVSKLEKKMALTLDPSGVLRIGKTSLDLNAIVAAALAPSGLAPSGEGVPVATDAGSVTQTGKTNLNLVIAVAANAASPGGDATATITIDTATVTQTGKTNVSLFIAVAINITSPGSTALPGTTAIATIT